jgi:Type VI secretion system effector, Hcp
LGDEPKKENGNSAEDSQKQAPELTNEDLEQTVGGAYDAFLKIDGIKGESTDSNHKDWIEIF